MMSSHSLVMPSTPIGPEAAMLLCPLPTMKSAPISLASIGIRPMEYAQFNNSGTPNLLQIDAIVFAFVRFP